MNARRAGHPTLWTAGAELRKQKLAKKKGAAQEEPDEEPAPAAAAEEDEEEEEVAAAAAPAGPKLSGHQSVKAFVRRRFLDARRGEAERVCFVQE